jgi:hypothetical protein
MTTHDFYFSQKHYEHLKKLEQAFAHDAEMAYTPVYFKGVEYTEMTQHGKEPMTTRFGDLVHLGTGTYEDVSFTKQKQRTT